MKRNYYNIFYYKEVAWRVDKGHQEPQEEGLAGAGWRQDRIRELPHRNGTDTITSTNQDDGESTTITTTRWLKKSCCYCRVQ
jgi:hypothetical protein